MTIDFSRAISLEARTKQRMDIARRDAMALSLRAIEQATLSVTGAVPLAEQLSWSAKEAAARDLLSRQTGAEHDAARALLVEEAIMAGQDVMELAERIVRSAEEFRARVLPLTGLRRSVQAAIQSATSEAEIGLALDQLTAGLQRMGFSPVSAEQL